MQKSIPEPADALWKAFAEAALVEDGVADGDRAAVLREARGQNAHRNAHQGHAHVGELVSMAQLEFVVFERAADFGLNDASEFDERGRRHHRLLDVTVILFIVVKYIFRR